MTTDDHPSVPGVEVDHRRVENEEDGVELHAAVAGPEDGDSVVLCHGFPDFWYGWHHQIPALVEAGYQVWAYDGRGYNTSDKPDGVDAYRIDRLMNDLIAVIDAAPGHERPVIGHDWGGLVGWYVADEYPERVERFVGINAPHPVAFREMLTSDPRQMARSAYAGVLSLPAVPDKLLSAGDYRLTTELLTRGSRPEAFEEYELDYYRRAWDRPGAMTGMLNWYRAAVDAPEDPPDPHVAPPTALFWGTDDPAYREELADRSVDLCEDAQLVRFSGATHWVHREVPGMVNDLLVQFLDGEELE